jgi:fluoride exporter
MFGFLPVMIGGAVGAGLRHAVGVAGLRLFGPGFPWWTLAVNCFGGLAMGLLVGTLARTGGNEVIRLFLGVGVLGGFTTFSAFGLESWQMIARGQWGVAGAYVMASVVGAVALTGLGLWIARA